jgi:hypothetical protein
MTSDDQEVSKGMKIYVSKQPFCRQRQCSRVLSQVRKYKHLKQEVMAACAFLLAFCGLIDLCSQTILSLRKWKLGLCCRCLQVRPLM